MGLSLEAPDDPVVCITLLAHRLLNGLAQCGYLGKLRDQADYSQTPTLVSLGRPCRLARRARKLETARRVCHPRRQHTIVGDAP